MTHTLRLILCAAVIVAGCSSNDTTDPPPAAANETAKEGSPTAPSGKEAPREPEAPEEKPSKEAGKEIVETGLPPLTMTSPAAAWVSSSKLNKEGLQFHKKAQYDKAAEKYMEAIQKDPGYINARYNLACARSLLGDAKGALALLKEFKEAPGCVFCEAKLALSRRDKDFKAMWNTPDFDAITKGASPPTNRTVKEIAKEVEAAYLRGDPDRLKPYLHSRARVRINTICPDCDENTSEMGARDKYKTVDTAGVHRFINEMASNKRNGLGLHGFKKMRCSGDCCKSAPNQVIMHNSYYLDKVCARSRSGVLFLQNIEVVDGM